MDDKLLGIFSNLMREHATEAQLEEIYNTCDACLEATHINIQTLGTILCASNQSEEMSSADNQMASFLVKNFGDEAQSLDTLKSHAGIELKKIELKKSQDDRHD